MTVVLVGFMGAGKTTVGRVLARRLGREFLDSDDVVEQRAGRTVREIFAADGEPYFRELEHAAVAELVTRPDTVVALGGGAAEDLRTQCVLDGVAVVHLHVGYDVALSRVGGDTGRPMLRRADLREVFERRTTTYDRIARFTATTADRTPEQVAELIEQYLTAADRATTLPHPAE